MFIALLRKEIVSHILTLRFGVMFVLIIGFVFGSFVFSVSAYKHRISEFNALQKSSFTGNNGTIGDMVKSMMGISDDLLHLKEDTPYRKKGVVQAVPVPPLSLFCFGLSNSWGTAFDMLGGWDRGSVDMSPMTNPLAMVFRSPDFVYIVNIVLSLLALLLAFDAVAGEKERGTLRLMLSYSVPRHLVILSKWIGGYLILILPFSIAFVASIAYAWQAGALALTQGLAFQVFILFVAACLYISAFFALGSFVSTITKQSTTALFISLFIWAMWIIIIPSIAPVIAKTVSPVPSTRKIDAEKGAIAQELNFRAQRMYETSQGLTEEQMRNTQQKMINEAQLQMLEWDKFYLNGLKRQERISNFIGRLSPSTTWIYATALLTQTGPSTYERIQKAKEKVLMEVVQKMEGIWNWQLTQQQYDDLKVQQAPAYQVHFAQAYDVVNESLNDILVLVVFNVLLFLAAFMAFLRYDVR